MGTDAQTLPAPAPRPLWTDLVYEGLFAPAPLYRSLAQAGAPSSSLLVPVAGIVLFISVLVPLAQWVVQQGDVGSLAVQVILWAVFGLLWWGLTGLLISGLAYLFTGQWRVQTFWILSGLATLPWMFLAPLALIQVGLGVVGVVLAVLGTLGLSLWTTTLFGMAVGIAFDTNSV